MNSPTTPAQTRTGGMWRIVAAREVMVKLTDRNFIIGTVVSLALIAGFFGIQTLLNQRTQTLIVAVTDTRSAGIVQATRDRVHAADTSRELTTITVADRAAGEQALRDERANSLLLSPDSADGWTLVSFREDAAELTAELGRTIQDRTIATNAEAAGTSIGALAKGATLTATALDAQAAADAGLAKGLGLAFAFLFYLTSLMFGMQIANSVVEEKQSRIVEILAAAIPVRQLLIGKVIGNTALAFGQLLLYAAVGLVGVALSKQQISIVALTSGIGWFLVFFVVGFVALACVWAVAGSLASRSEDLQTTSGPITMVLVLVFLVAMTVEGSVRSAVSFVPIVSAIIMPARIAAGEVGWWEPAVALLATVALAAVTIVIGERLYRRSLLQTRGRVSMRAAWTAADDLALAHTRG